MRRFNIGSFEIRRMLEDKILKADGDFSVLMTDGRPLTFYRWLGCTGVWYSIRPDEYCFDAIWPIQID